MVNIRQLQVFKTLCDELNFTKTAEKLNMTQPAVSHVIGSLEEEFGVPAAPVAVSGSIDTDDFPLTDGQQQALHRYMTAYYTTLGDLTEASTDGVFCADDIAAYEQAVWE